MRKLQELSSPRAALFGALMVAGASVVGACSSSNPYDGVSGPGGVHPGSDASADGNGGGPGGDAGLGDDGGMPGAPFEPVGPETYVPKVKNLLTGLAATDAEVKAVAANPAALRGLIDTWMALPQFQDRMMAFLRNAFQQNQVQFPVLLTNLGLNFNLNEAYQARFERSVMDSFPLTVWQTIAAAKPFNEVLSTQTYMLTTAMMSVLSYADDMQVADTGKTDNRLNARAAIAQLTLDPTSTATLAQSLDPTGPDFMHWNLPVASKTCTVTTPVTFTGAGQYQTLMSFLMGKLQYAPCGTATERFQPQFADSDWTDYRMVTLHVAAPTATGATPAFYDILKLRAATDLTLHSPRMGFFGTLAFDANWGTNTSNEARVTANQSLIVGIGQSIAGENVITPFPVNATDADHASLAACQACHAQLDPYKQFFRQSFTLTYHDQLDTTQIMAPANFGIDGVTASGQGVADIAKILATHPRFALAWVLKLHYWANSTPALETDPEVLRIAQAFQQSNFDFRVLVRELFSSPLVTYASATQTTQTNGVIMSIVRRDQYCAALSNRLGLTDVCGAATPSPTSAQKTMASRAILMPVDTYYRAYALPSLPTSPDLFYRDTTESMCSLIAGQVVDATGGNSRYVSTNPTAAIADLVATVMGVVPSDPRSAQAVQILTDNFTQSKAAGATASDALKATFTLACIAPSSVIVGL